MKLTNCLNKRVFLLYLICFIAIGAYGYAPMVDKFNSLTKWLIPAYLYCFLFGLIIFIGLIIFSNFYKEKTNHFYEQLNSYLRVNPFTNVDLGGILLAIPLGLISCVLFRIFWFSAVGLVLPLMLIFIIILSFGTLRNRIFNRHTLKFMSFICIASFFSCMFFIICSQLGLFQLDQEYHEWGRNYNQFYTHPFDSLKCIWEFVPYFVILVPLADIIVLTGKILFKMPIISYIKS